MFRVFVCTVLCLGFVGSSRGQQQPAEPMEPRRRDVKAISVFNDCLNSRNSTASQIRDFTASGTITYFWAGKEVTGPVTIKARGLDQFHLQADLPDGTRSFTVSHGKGSLTEFDGKISEVPFHNAIKAGTPVIPQLVVAAVLADNSSNIVYDALTEISGQQAHKIRIQQMVPKVVTSADPDGRFGKLLSKEILVDQNTHRIVKISDKTHPIESFKNEMDREFTFENYVSMEAIEVPTLIRERIGGTTISEIQIAKVTFNSGLSDSDFSVE
jgi:hypothetical protein